MLYEGKSLRKKSFQSTVTFWIYWLNYLKYLILIMKRFEIVREPKRKSSREAQNFIF